jgi:ATP-binding cassette subfamily B protein
MAATVAGIPRQALSGTAALARHDILGRYLLLLAREADRTVKTRLAASLAVAVAASLLAGLAPLALKNLVDTLTMANVGEAQAHGGHHAAILFGAAYLLALCTSRVLSEFRPLLAAHAEQRLQTRIGRRYFAHLLELPLPFHVGSRTGALVNGLNQAEAACRLVLSSLMQCTTVIVELLAVLAVVYHLGQPALAAVFAFSAAAYGLVFANGAAGIRTRSRAVSEAIQRLHANLADSLLNVEAVKCFNAAGAVVGRFERAAGALEAGWSGLHRRRSRIGLAVAAVFTASMGSSLAVAGTAVANGTLSTGGFVLVTVYVLQMVRPLELLGGAVRDAVQAVEFARPLLDVLTLRPEDTAALRPPASDDATTADRDEDGAAAAAPPRITFDDVSLAYGNRRVLRGFSLEIPAGATVAIVGASGAGKSSLARLLLRLIDAGAGRICWDGLPLGQQPLAALRNRIAFVPQEATLFDDSIANNIALGRPGASRQHVAEAARRAQLHALAGTPPAGLDTPVGERGVRLSGGERQRIALARAILKRPQVWLFDEVTSMLDGPTEKALLEDLREVCAGCTTIFITHRLAAARGADFIAVLEDGKVAEQGSHEQLLALGGRYARMWLAQADRGFAPRGQTAGTPLHAPDGTGGTDARDEPTCSAAPSRPFSRRRAAHRRHA